MLNKVMLIGNIGADPETRFLQDGTCVCNLRLATSEKFKGKDGNQQEKTEWHKIVIWGRLGEICNQYLTKGSRVYIEGKIETRKWTNKEGQDQYTTEIKGHEMKMLGGGTQSNNTGGNQNSNQGGFTSHGGPQGGNQQDSNQRSGSGAGKNNDPFANDPDFGDVPVDDDLPF